MAPRKRPNTPDESSKARKQLILDLDKVPTILIYG